MYVRQSHTDTHGKVLTKPYCRCGENIYTTSLCEYFMETKLEPCDNESVDSFCVWKERRGGDPGLSSES